MTDHNDDDQCWLETILAGLEERSEAVKKALMRAVEEREGAGPLLGTIGLIAAGCRRSVFLTDRSCEPLRRARARR